MLDPGRELFSGQASGGHVEHQLLPLVDARAEFSAVEDEEPFHRGVGHALIAIEKRMIQRDRETERRGLRR